MFISTINYYYYGNHYATTTCLPYSFVYNDVRLGLYDNIIIAFNDVNTSLEIEDEEETE